MVNIVVTVHLKSTLAQPASIDYRGVIEFIAEHSDIRTSEHSEHPEVGGEAGGKDHGSLTLFPFGESQLEFVMHWPGAHNESRSSRAGSPFVECGMGGGDDRWIVGQAEIIVRRKVDDMTRIDNS